MCLSHRDQLRQSESLTPPNTVPAPPNYISCFRQALDVAPNGRNRHVREPRILPQSHAVMYGPAGLTGGVCVCVCAFAEQRKSEPHKCGGEALQGISAEPSPRGGPKLWKGEHCVGPPPSPVCRKHLFSPRGLAKNSQGRGSIKRLIMTTHCVSKFHDFFVLDFRRFENGSGRGWQRRANAGRCEKPR